MKPYKTVIYSFLLGGLLALIAQGLFGFWNAALTGTPMEFFRGGAVLVSMGVIGFIIGGLAIYQYFEEWATFGALLPFSGFAMAVGMKMLGPWFKGESLGKSIWQGAWLVIWFNAVGAVVCIAFGYLCGMMGWVPTDLPPAIVASTEPIVSLTIGARAFFMGGCLTALFQIVWLIVAGITPKAKHVWILMFAWMCGAIFAPMGISGTLANLFGQGFSVMIPVGGFNMFNVGVDFFHGGEHFTEGLIHLGSFLLAVFGLFFTGLGTFIVYNAKFGRKPLGQVHLEKAQHAVAECEAHTTAATELPVEANDENA